jgi:hypothetical protein
MARLPVLVGVLFVFGCGSDDSDDGSGVDPTLTLGTLGAADTTAVCTYGASLSRTVDCGGSSGESTTNVEDCVDLVESLSETCDATVDELETCFEDLAAQTDDEICGLETPASCDFLGDPDCLDI